MSRSVARSLLVLSVLLAACGDDGDAASDAGVVDGGVACGDSVCGTGEDCTTCAADCGACGPTTCGDGTCGGAEACEDCPSDCGLCPLDDQPGQRICVGGGSGYLDLSDAGTELGLTGGDTLCIEAGTYDGLDLGNLRAADGSKIVVVNEGKVEITGPTVFHDLENVEFRGDGDDTYEHGFVLRDIAGRAITVNGEIQHVTWSNLEISRSTDYTIFIYNAELVWDGTSATALHDLKFFDILGRDNKYTFFQVGNFSSWADARSIVDGIEIARADIDGTNGSCTVVSTANTIGSHLHHNTVTNTGADDTGHCGVFFLSGNGSVHHNVVKNFWGNAVRSWCIGTEGRTAIDIYDNLVVGSRKYSGVEVQAFDDVINLESAEPCQWRIANNTFGNLTALDYEAAMIDAYYLAGSTVEVRNNLGFNIALDRPFDPEKNYVVHYAGADGDLVTESNNLYGQTVEEIGLVDDDECQLTADSPAINAGEIVDFVLNDLAGIARPQGAAYDLGAREHVGP